MQKQYPTIKELDTEIVAISVDSVEANKKLREDLGLEFPILSDAQLETIRTYQLVHEKGFEGKSIARPAEYLVDPSGNIIKSWVSEGIQARTKTEDIIAELRKL